MDNFRRYNVLDKLILELEKKTLVLNGSVKSTRPNPSLNLNHKPIDQPPISSTEKKHSAGLMRINHTGEVCAQALYRGQALMLADKELKEMLYQAAEEEIDHLAWCQERLEQLQSHSSRLNSLWYLGSFGLGVCASIFGRKWNLGFLMETERQVSDHITDNLNRLPANDKISQKVLEQMYVDEQQHAKMAETQGGQELPLVIKLAMSGMSKLMKIISYRI